jgi:hypothetical protein
MLDLFVSHHAKCEKCGRDSQCVRVSFWDGRFSGLICWIDLIKLVNELSKDPECRKKFAQARDAKEAEAASQLPPSDHSGTEHRGRTRTAGRSETYGHSHGSGHSESWSHSQQVQGAEWLDDLLD